MEREEAKQRLLTLRGKNLRELASQFGVTVIHPVSGKINKGWAGHVIERFLGLPLTSSSAPNFGSWELKVVPLVYRVKDEAYVLKETMAITMLDPIEVLEKNFKDSHLFNKLRKVLIVARTYEDVREERSFVYSVSEFNLDNQNVYKSLESDYELIRSIVRTEGFKALSGRLGRYIQPRTKGRGHGSISRAFYARKALVAYLLGLAPRLFDESHQDD
jgi:DNA mismatch repair protein MutH